MKQKCRIFLKDLGDDITSDDLFFTLKIVAEEMGYELKAEQRGYGTYIHFVKES